VVADVTSRAAPVFAAFKDKGTLRVGAAADVAIIEMREGDFNFADNFGSTRNYKYRLFPFASVMGGKKTI
jgi:dihydroorotase